MHFNHNSSNDNNYDNNNNNNVRKEWELRSVYVHRRRHLCPLSDGQHPEDEYHPEDQPGLVVVVVVVVVVVAVGSR